jgi:uroporphyrin-III C-methyltransferase
MSSGYVSLIGAGPGDPELITVKGLRRLRAADVVVYDALSAPELLDECRASAELLDVGKRSGAPSPTQESINALLIARAQAGLLVARLKGGDPFVFGRGGEEAEALQAAGVAWEVIPGVSSAIAVPAYAGIPVTHREYGSSFAVITGHEPPGRGESRLRWQALAQGIDTLVFLMALARMREVADQLIAHGRPGATPAAVIHMGTTRDQATVVGTLATIADDAARAGIAAPATLIIGEVVRLRERISWFEAMTVDAIAPPAALVSAPLVVRQLG